MAANEAPHRARALQIGVDEVCAYAFWPVGDAFVLADDGSGDLVPARIWHPGSAGALPSFPGGHQRLPLPRGVGLPGRVLATGEAAWIIDLAEDANFPRARSPWTSGLKCAFGFPVLARSEVVAVLEFFTGEPGEPDPALLDAMANIGTQLGRVFERQRSEAELRLAKDAAEAASRAKSSFLANMSHELRTLSERHPGLCPGPRTGRRPRRAAPEGRRRHRAVGAAFALLINEILDLAKIESGTIEMHRAPFDFTGLLAGRGRSHARSRRGQRPRVHVRVPGRPPRGRPGRRKRLRQVLTNLLDNAIKYTASGGVRLTVARHDRAVPVRGRRHGDRHQRRPASRIFETFHQVRSEQEFIEGTGLGLAISKTLVALDGRHAGSGEHAG